jgi:ribosomal subunit interface protein
VADKLQKMERYDNKLIEASVELLHERNRRQSEHSQRVEITVVSRGPVIRAEACSADFYSALDLAIGKLDTRLRKAADRRRIHRGRHAPVSVGAATAALMAGTPEETAAGGVALAERADSEPVEETDQPWHIVRMKEHPAEPMTADDALFQMELVGHDFFLFLDKDSGRPSVVYRRRRYDYGVISLA